MCNAQYTSQETPVSRGMSKAERLLEMERLYSQRAYTDQELAERMGVDRTTIYRSRRELEQRIPFIEEESGRWKIDKSSYLSSIRLNLTEALVLYLAARKTSQQIPSAHIPAANALEKLAAALRQPMTDKLVKSADKVLSQRDNLKERDIFETLARGWVDQIKIRLEYRRLGGNQTVNHTVHPYLIEPSPWTDSIYLIGLSEKVDKIISFKVNRIQHANLTTLRYEIPDDFDEEQLLQHTWGIWTAEGEPSPVKLKFSPGRASQRLSESTWHPLEEKTELEDGGILWEAPIGEWKEMLPWIRGWGPDVEVIEPPADAS